MVLRPSKLARVATPPSGTGVPCGTSPFVVSKPVGASVCPSTLRVKVAGKTNAAAKQHSRMSFSSFILSPPSNLGASCGGAQGKRELLGSALRKESRLGCRGCGSYVTFED